MWYRKNEEKKIKKETHIRKKTTKTIKMRI